MATAVINSWLSSLVVILTEGSDQQMQLNAIKMEENSGVASKTLSEIEIPKNTGLIVVVVKKSGTTKYIYNLSLETVLNPGDVILVMGWEYRVKKLKEYIK